MHTDPVNAHEPCPACGLIAVDRQRVRADANTTAHPIDALACLACGDWWFEAAGERITLATITRMGLVGRPRF